MKGSEKSRQFLLIASMGLAYFLGRQILTPILPLYIISVGATKLELGLIMAVPSLVTIALRLPLSIVGDRVGRWFIVVVSLGIQILGMLLYAVVKDVSWFYFVAVLMALSWALYGPASMALALDLAPAHKRAEAMGRYFTLIGITMLTGPLIAGLLATSLDYRSIFAISVLPSLFGLVVLMRSPRSRPVSARKEHASPSILSLRSVIEVLRIKQVWTIAIVRTTFWLASAVFATLFPVYAQEDLSLSATLISFMFAVRGLSNTLVRAPSGRICDKIGRKRPLTAAYIMSILVFLSLSEFKTTTLLLIAMTLYGVSWGTRVVSETALLGDTVPSEKRGLAMATWETIDDVGGMAGSVMAGVTTLFFDAAAVFRIAALIILGGVGVLTALVEEANPRSQTRPNVENP